MWKLSLKCLGMTRMWCVCVRTCVCVCMTTTRFPSTYVALHGTDETYWSKHVCPLDVRGTHATHLHDGLWTSSGTLSTVTEASGPHSLQACPGALRSRPGPARCPPSGRRSVCPESCASLSPSVADWMAPTHGLHGPKVMWVNTYHGSMHAW